MKGSGAAGPDGSPGQGRDPETRRAHARSAVTAETHPHLPRVLRGTSLLLPLLCDQTPAPTQVSSVVFLNVPTESFPRSETALGLPSNEYMLRRPGP